MRVLSILCLLAGIGLGILYPNYITYYSGGEIGTWTVFTRQTGFKPVTVELSKNDAPVLLVVKMDSLGNILQTNAETTLTLTAATGNRTVLAEVMTFRASTADTKTPQYPGASYTVSPGVISAVDDAPYLIVIGPGDQDMIDMKQVTLSLRRNSLAADPRYQPAGFILMALGFIGLILSISRGGGGGKNEPEKPGMKWGREGV